MELLHVLIIIAIMLVIIALPVTAIMLLVKFFIRPDQCRNNGADGETSHIT